ncbi:hypothetical protein JHK85_002440 [Glycine max]|nr:hypothetical protein JHK85_002440 [Glycine max]
MSKSGKNPSKTTTNSKVSGLSSGGNQCTHRISIKLSRITISFQIRHLWEGVEIQEFHARLDSNEKESQGELDNCVMAIQESNNNNNLCEEKPTGREEGKQRKKEKGMERAE